MNKPRPLRIMFLSVSDNDGWGGTEIQTAHQAAALVNRGHEVTICSFGLADFKNLTENRAQWPGGDRVRIVNCNVTGKRGRPDAIYGNVLPWRQTLAIWKPIRGDVAIFPKGSYHHGSLWASLMARLRFKRNIAIEHSSCPPNLPKPGKRVRIRKALTTTTVCVAEANAQFLVSHQGYHPRRVLTIHNGTDPKRFHPCPQRRQAFRQQHGLTPEEQVILFVGRITHAKGAPLAMEALAKVATHDPGLRLRLVFCGKGDQVDAIRRRTDDLGLSDRVLMLGHQDRPELACAGADVYLQASGHEGLSLALLEAMASGCVCVATDVGGTREVITHPGLGWLVPPDDVDAMSQALAAALGQSPSQRQQMAREGIGRVTTHFNHQTQLGRMLELIETGRVSG